VNRDAAEQTMVEFQLMAEFLSDSFQYFNCFLCDFSANPVSREKQHI
jgi:hypothetical protein